MKKMTLEYGPYKPPRIRVGKGICCRRHGDVIVAGITDAPIAWPVCHTPQGGGKLVPILCGDLVRAVTEEAVQAVAYNWGVSRWTVQRWRRALGVGRMTPGTLKLWQRLAPVRLSHEARLKGNRHS